MTQAKNGTVNFDDEKLYYEVGGEGETLVLVHAGFVDGRMWDTQWEALTQHYRVIRFDMRGYGRSDKIKASVSRRKDLHELLRHLNIERAALIGCSMGGETVIDFALDYPELVSALVVVSAVPSGFEMQGEPPQELFEMMGAMEKGDLGRASELQLRLWVDGPTRQPNQVDANVRRKAAEMNRIFVENGTFAIGAEPVEPLDIPAAGRLNEITVPTLVIAGALDNSEIVRIADVMAAEIKGAKKVIIQDAAHVPNMEKPDIFNQAVLEFLDGALG